MLSPDRSNPRADPRRRPAFGAGNGALWDDEAQPFNPDAPWDDESAEALMCLCESEEGRLSRPASGERVRSPLPERTADAPEREDGIDRAWLEAHLTSMAQQLQDALAQASPDKTLAALSGRLDTIEQRFGATLGRIAQRTDLDALRAIEERMLELSAQLERARERLDRIDTLEDEVRALARKADEARAQRVGGLEKLLRDCIAEWREGEQRTASVLQNIEEAIGRLGEAVDAMEAAKPAPDLTVPPLTGAELGPLAGANGAYLPAAEGQPPQVALFQPTLDAADYAAKPFAGDAPSSAPEAPLLDLAGGTAGKPFGAKLTPRALRIKALRAKMRQARRRRRAGASYVPGGLDELRNGTFRRASLSVLLMAGAALMASSAYFVYRSFATAAPVGTAIVAEEKGSKPVTQ